MVDQPLDGYKWSQESHDAIVAGLPGGGINRLTQLSQGNDALVTNPALMSALDHNNASPEQAQAINNFMSGLDLEKQVHLSRASGVKMTLNAKQQDVLGQMGVNYADVSQTQVQADQTLASQLSAKGMAVAKDQNGQTILNPDGTPLVQKATSPTKKSGWSFGRILSDVGGALTKGWNLVDTTGVKVGQDLNAGLHSVLGDNSGIDLSTGTAVSNKPDSASDEARFARDAGYDPSSFFSMVAYQASGKSHMHLSPLQDEWDQASNGTGVAGHDALDQAIQFSTNPEHYRQQIENDPNTTVEEKAHKMAFLSSQSFSDLVKRVQGSTSTVGNVVAQGAGLDPVKDATAYKVTSAGTDFAASLALDPLILLGKGFKATRLAQIGIKDTQGAIDPNKIRAIFTPMSTTQKLTSPFITGVQRRWTNYLDQTQVIANDTASTVEKAQAYQKIQSQFPELAPMTEHFTGANQVIGFDEKAGKLVMGSGEPIRTLEAAGDYIASKMVQVAASQGKAALETSLMPGATSLYGFRMLKGSMAKLLAGGEEKINLARLSKATSILPTADEAIDATGRVIAARTDLATAQKAVDAYRGAYNASAKAAIENLDSATAALKEAEKTSALEAVTAAGEKTSSTLVGKTLAGHLDQAKQALADGGDARGVLASAQRKAMEDPVLRGQIQQNMARRGTINGEGFNLFGMISARNELATRRLTSLLPRNTVFKLDDAASTENIYRYAQIYMNKGDAALTAARWAGGDEATRRALISHLQLQTAHAAGFGYTESGRAALDSMSSLLDNGTTLFGGAKSTTQRYAAKAGLDVAEDPELGGQAAHYAVHPDQVIEEWRLPNFAQLQRDANRFGIWDRILGRAFTSQTADVQMHGFKMIQLLKPSTFTRNALEGWGNAVVRGEAAGGIRAKALGVEIEQKVVAELNAKAVAQGWTKAELRAEIDKFSPLQRRGWLAKYIPHLIMGQWYRSALGKMMGDDLESEYIIKLLDKPGEARRMMDGYGLQHLRADVDPAGMSSHLGHTEDGFGSAQLSFGAATGGGKKIDSWEYAATDGFEGASKYSRALGIRLASRPEYSGLLLDAAKSGDGDIGALMKYVDQSPDMQKAFRQMRFSSLYKDSNDQWVKAVTEDDKLIAREQLVRRQVEDISYMMHGKNGDWAQGVEDHFRTTGRVPDGDWVHKNLKGDARPEAVEAPVYVAVPVKPTVAGWVNSLYEKPDKAYVRFVEDPIQRTTSMPLFLHSYGQQRAAFANYEKALVEEHGFTAEAADNLMQESAMKAAWVKTEAMIDDPGLKSQFDIVGRNFFAYSRATQAMIRRWGQTMVQDPTRMVKATLATQAAEHAGVIWTDANGEPNFTLPGSGAFINLMVDAMAHVPILGGFMQIPTVPDLTGKVMLSVPGLENPFHLSATPLVNVPFRAIERLVPDHMGLMDEIDRSVNGPIGAGEIGSQFQPVILKKFFAAFSKDDQNGMLASATLGAITNLIAAGKVPKANATTDELQRFNENVRINVRNQLFMRAVFGLWSPAPPSSPTNSTSGSKEDFAFQIQGIHGLDQEFKQLLNDMGGDYASAAQLWAAMHPDKLVYTQAKSGSVANKAYLPSTIDAMKWTQDNHTFIHQYQQIAGYFLPEMKGDFNGSSYATQLAIGLRQKKTPKEFLNTALVNLVRPEYDTATKDFDAKIAAAKAANDPEAAKTLATSRAAYVTDFNARNPLWADQGTMYQQKAHDANNALAELRKMVDDPKVPADVPKGVISEMIQSWDTYQQWKASNPANTQEQKDARTLMASAFGQFMAAKAQQVPGLIDLYKGVFRQLDNKLIDLSASN